MEQVILEPAEQMHIIPHQVHDGLEASSLTSLVNILQQQGFGGGVRLLQVRQESPAKLQSEHLHLH